MQTTPAPVTRLIDELLEVTGVDVLFFDVAQVETHLGPAGSAQLARTCGATSCPYTSPIVSSGSAKISRSARCVASATEIGSNPSLRARA